MGILTTVDGTTVAGWLPAPAEWPGMVYGRDRHRRRNRHRRLCGRADRGLCVLETAARPVPGSRSRRRFSRAITLPAPRCSNLPAEASCRASITLGGVSGVGLIQGQSGTFRLSGDVRVAGEDDERPGLQFRRQAHRQPVSQAPGVVAAPESRLTVSSVAESPDWLTDPVLARGSAFVQPRDVPRHEVDFEVHSRARLRAPEGRHRQRVRHQVHVKA